MKFDENITFVWDSMFEDICVNYCQQVSDPSALDVTVYHEGSDGGQFDWIEVDLIVAIIISVISVNSVISVLSILIVLIILIIITIISSIIIIIIES